MVIKAKSKQSIWKLFGTFLLAALLFAGIGIGLSATAVEAKAASNKEWVTVGDKVYYYENGEKYIGKWKEWRNKWYYLMPKTGEMAKHKIITDKGKKYYLGRSGAMVTGWTRLNGDMYYFTPGSGEMHMGWLLQKSDGETKKYYMGKTTGKMFTGGFFSKGGNYYYATATGEMHTGFKKVDGDYYYFTLNGAARGWQKVVGKTEKWYYLNPDTCKMMTGWIEVDGKTYYLSKESETIGIMLKGTQKIGGKTYVFDEKDGHLIQGNSLPESNLVQKPNNSKTIKNFLLGAMQPVGKIMYQYGAGHDWKTMTTKGLPNSRFDCSAFVGWATYQVMHTKSGEGSGYAGFSGDMVPQYAARGWGDILTQAQFQQKGMKAVAGDVIGNNNHIVIVVGQCEDKSAVIVHAPSTGKCVQIAGTPTPDGNSNSQAVKLAQKYMPYFNPPSGTWNGYGGNYLLQGHFLRWNNKTLADPNGYRTMTADEILADMFDK